MATQLVELGLALLLARLFLAKDKNDVIPGWLHWTSGGAALLLFIDPAIALANWVRHLQPLT